jgi:hypothetical protein
MAPYFFEGYPRAFLEAVPDVQHPPLAMTVALAERWIIGHEYGHGLLPPIEDAPPEVNVSKVEEHLADYNATLATVLSASRLDAMPPVFPLGAATFALKCLASSSVGRASCARAATRATAIRRRIPLRVIAPRG